MKIWLPYLFVVFRTGSREVANGVESSFHLQLFEIRAAGASLRLWTEGHDFIVVCRLVIHVAERVRSNHGQYDRRHKARAPLHCQEVEQTFTCSSKIVPGLVLGGEPISGAEDGE